MREASRLGLTGWVRNLESGEVELWAEGDPAALAAFREWLAEGPPGARVSSVSVDIRAPTGHFSGFTIDS